MRKSVVNLGRYFRWRFRLIRSTVRYLLGHRIFRRPLRTKHGETNLGVNLIGPIEFVSGLGTSARGFAVSIMQAGINLNVIPWRLGFERLPRISVDFPRSDMQA